MYALGISYGLRSNYYWVVKKVVARFAAGRHRGAALRTTASPNWSPSNVDARLVQGLHDYIVGSLPWR